jgi:hypothetical protein
MKLKYFAAALCAALLLTGCGKNAPDVPAPDAADSTVPAATVPADGDPGNVTAKGTYTVSDEEINAVRDTVVAEAAGNKLTNSQLQIYYWLEVAAHRASDCPDQPDYTQSLDTQPCPLDSSVNSWQQYFLRKAKSRQNAANLLPWSWRFNVPWTEPVLRELGRTVDGAPENSSPAEAAAGEAAAEKNPRGGDSCRSRYRILDVWVRGQAQYHREALIMTEARIRRNDRISNLALLLALATYAAALVFEICVGGLFSGSVLLGQRQMEVIRVILKVAMGSFSAMTLFAGNYYGKLSLEETAQDHRRMAALYEKTEEEILRTGETEDLITKLAREELSENSSWYAYQCKNRPDISL